MAESSAERWRFSGGRDSETGSSGGTHVAPSERWRSRWDHEFESPLLQRRVSLSPAANFEPRKPRLSARVCEAGLGIGSAETRRAFHCPLTGGRISVGPYSSTA